MTNTSLHFTSRCHKEVLGGNVLSGHAINLYNSLPSYTISGPPSHPLDLQRFVDSCRSPKKDVNFWVCYVFSLKRNLYFLFLRDTMHMSICVCVCSVTKSCLTFCNLMDCSMLGFPVLPYLLEFSQIHVH